MNDSKINIGVIIGGNSTECEISLISGLQTYLAIDDSKYNKMMIYIDKNNHLYMGMPLSKLETYQKDEFYLSNKDIKEICLIEENKQVYYYLKNKKRKKYPIDIFIPVVHGYNIEDGTLSAFLNMYNAIYTSSDVIPSAIIQDKDVTKSMLKHLNIPTLNWITKWDFNNTNINKYPVVVKPAYLGSSIGINLANNQSELEQSMNEAFKYADKIIIEEALVNYREFNCAVLKDHATIIPSAVEEVRHDKDILTFIEKYESDINKLSDNTNRIIPAQISEDLYLKIQKLSCDIYKKFNLAGVVRVDYLYDIDKDKIYVNEINNIPGSLSFYLYEPIGISFTNLVDMLVQNAMIRYEQKKKLITHFKSNVLNKKSTKLMK